MPKVILDILSLSTLVACKLARYLTTLHPLDPVSEWHGLQSSGANSNGGINHNLVEPTHPFSVPMPVTFSHIPGWAQKEVTGSQRSGLAVWSFHIDGSASLGM